MLFVLQVALGVLAGLAMLEVTLRLNPGLMVRGVPLDAPVDAPINEYNYDFHSTDGDAFYWNRDLIAPVPPQQDAVEATVRFETDEFGFPNPAPAPPQIDVVVLGRSYSLGAQASTPWPREVASQTGLKILNLSQAGSSIDVKLDFFLRYGVPRRPRWAIVEVLPAEDIINYSPPEPLLVERLPFQTLRTLLLRAYATQQPPDPSHVIYPLEATVDGKPIQLVFFLPDVEAMTADAESMGKSREWQGFSRRLLDLANEAHHRGICVALLYTTTKPEVYLPLVSDVQPLMPALVRTGSWQLTPGRNLALIPEPNIPQLQALTNTPRSLVQQFAQEYHLPLVDPTEAMAEAARAGQQPFLLYDTHWSALGHHIVAQQVISMLQNTPCH